MVALFSYQIRQYFYIFLEIVPYFFNNSLFLIYNALYFSHYFYIVACLFLRNYRNDKESTDIINPEHTYQIPTLIITIPSIPIKSRTYLPDPDITYYSQSRTYLLDPVRSQTYILNPDTYRLYNQSRSYRLNTDNIGYILNPDITYSQYWH